ncbi:MAG: hypothetical protein U5L45_00255 [Saprospiraceae bacterium]|nr:hypothetical protein [Saprospiraceae bacterium]
MGDELLEVLSSLTAIDKTELAGKLTKPEGEAAMTESEKAAVVKQLLSARFKSVVEEKEKATKRTVLSALEKEVKARFEYEGNEQGVALFEAIAQKHVEKNAKPPVNVDFAKWTSDEWEKQEAFRQRVAAMVTDATKDIFSKIAIADAEKEAAVNDLNDFKAKSEKAATDKRKFEIAKECFLGLNPNGVSQIENAERRRLKIDRFIGTLEMDAFKLSGDSIVPIDSEGNPKLHGADKGYAPITIEYILKDEWYDGFNVVSTVPSQPTPTSASGGTASNLTQANKHEIKRLVTEGGDYVTYYNKLPENQKNEAMQYITELKT